MRNVIIVSPQFPPSSLAGVHRARHLARYLPLVGWNPIVLCVDERFHAEKLDPALGRRVSLATEVVKVSALPLALTRPLGIGDISVRAGIQLRRKLVELLRTRPIDAVLITGMPFYPLLNAGMVARRFKVPVVLDFQDPWVSAWGEAQPPLSKAGLTHFIATVLEPMAVRHAAFVTSVSDTQNDRMADRYPWLARGRMEAIPIGGDPEDFDQVGDEPAREGPVRLDPDKINLSYVGTFLPRAPKLLRAVFRAYRRLAEQAPELAGRVRFNFVGTSNQPNDQAKPVITDIAREEGVSEVVFEHPSRVGFLDALGILKRSDGLLLIGSDEPHYTASKIYPALMSGTPFLSLFHRASSAHEILSASGGGAAFAFADDAELEALIPDLADGLRRLVDTPEALGVADAAAYADYTARSVAARYGIIFDRLVAERQTGGRT